MIPRDPLDRTEPTSEQRRGRAPDDRAVSEVLGAILLFALVVLLIALIQLNAVPAANQQVEFEHNQRVQGDLQEFQEILLRTANAGTEGTVKIEAGTGYPSRFFLFNPPRATGTVALTDGGNVTIENAVASGEAKDYLDGTPLRFESNALTYTANYNEYRNAPTTVYENGVLYNEFTDEQRVVSTQGSFVDGRTISLIALQGQYSTATGGSLSVGTVPISAPAQDVSVTTETGSPTDDPLVITIPTRLTADEWRDILDDELQTNGGYVLAVSDPDTTDGLVTVEFAPGETYDLRLAAVGIGSGFDAETSEAYIVDVSGNGETVPEGGSQRLVAQVRDKYNNPVSGVTIGNDTGLAGGRVQFVDSDRTNDDGRIALRYRAPNNVNGTQNATVTVWFGGNGTERERARFRLSVFDADGSGSGSPDDASGGNPINPADVRLVSSTLSDTGCDGRKFNCTVNLEFENRDTTAAKEIKELRISYYSVNNGAGGGQDYLPPETVKVDDGPLGPGGNNQGTTVPVDGTFKAVTVDDLEKSGTGGNVQTYNFAFQRFKELGKPSYDDGAIHTVVR